jgi:uncharacterized protein DUF5658
VTQPRPLVLTTHPAAGDAIWIGFALVQAMDGVLTIVGIGTMGLAIEANPLVAWYAHAFGPATGVIAAKLFAVACGVILHMRGYHKALAAVVLLYLLYAVGPWVRVLYMPM